MHKLFSRVPILSTKNRSLQISASIRWISSKVANDRSFTDVVKVHQSSGKIFSHTKVDRRSNPPARRPVAMPESVWPLTSPPWEEDTMAIGHGQSWLNSEAQLGSPGPSQSLHCWLKGDSWGGLGAKFIQKHKKTFENVLCFHLLKVSTHRWSENIG